jgi:hypothetical protein
MISLDWAVGKGNQKKNNGLLTASSVGAKTVVADWRDNIVN